MLSHSLETTHIVQHAATGDFAAVYRVVDSPYATDPEGTQRVQVWGNVPGAGGTFQGWDYWLLKDCILLPNAPIAAGSAVRLVSNSGQSLIATVIAAGVQEIFVMFEDGQCKWVALSHVAAAILPLTNSIVQIA